MVYAGPNKPIPPVDDPYQMFARLYGGVKDQESLASVLDDVQTDLEKIRSVISADDRRLLDEHESFVRHMEQQLRETRAQAPADTVPELEPGIRNVNDNLPKLSRCRSICW
jgi:hypothetical protein